VGAGVGACGGGMFDACRSSPHSPQRTPVTATVRAAMLTILLRDSGAAGSSAPSSSRCRCVEVAMRALAWGLTAVVCSTRVVPRASLATAHARTATLTILAQRAEPAPPGATCSARWRWDPLCACGWQLRCAVGQQLALTQTVRQQCVPTPSISAPPRQGLGPSGRAGHKFESEHDDGHGGDAGVCVGCDGGLAARCSHNTLHPCSPAPERKAAGPWLPTSLPSAPRMRMLVALGTC